MMTFGQLKAELQPIIWPTGEAVSLQPAHQKFYVDALVDLQKWVECLQYDNTSIVDQCATYYNCGITVLPAPRGSIKRVSVVDKINPTTHKEDPASPTDWCSKVPYQQIDYCHIRRFIEGARRGGCCNISWFFGLFCRKGRFPTPTDAGLTGLATLPLGFHYGQSSTDDPNGRAGRGVWALDRGKIHIAPWIQSTETVIIEWDGIKREWADVDLVDDDPTVSAAIEEYQRWQHAAKFDRDEVEAARAKGEYARLLATLIHDCREETRIRNCEPSRARATGFSTDTTNNPLFFNDVAAQATATCPSGQIGNPVNITIPAGTVSSNISVADANQKALNEAQSQANAQLVCQPSAATFKNTAQSFTAQCSTGETGAPAPDGNPVTVTIPAGTITSSISQDDANAQALTLAEQEATAQLQCTWWNRAQSFTATCPSPSVGSPVTVTIGAHTVSSTISQSDADATALNQAKVSAQSQLSCSGGGGVFFNTPQSAESTRICPPFGIHPACQVTVIVTVAANVFSSTISQADANVQAITAAQQRAALLVNVKCGGHQCGTFTIPYS